MKKRISAAAVVAAFAVAGMLGLPQAVHAEEGDSYVALGLGGAAISGPGMQGKTSLAFSGAAGFKLDPVFALEFPFMFANRYPTVTGDKVAVMSVGVSGLALAPMDADGDSFFIKLGYFWPRSGITSPSAPAAAPLKGSDKSGIGYGFGFQYRLGSTPGTYLRLGAERLPAGVFADTTVLTHYYLQFVMGMK